MSTRTLRRTRESARGDGHVAVTPPGIPTAGETLAGTERSGPVVGSVCTGYGGLDIGVLAAFGGGRIAWCADPDPHITKILAARFPGVPNLGDIRAIDWTRVEPVEVLTAGFPCQDISAAGRRLGIEKGRRSGLWTDIVAGVRILRPALLSLHLSNLILGCVSDFTDSGRAEAEAVLLGCFVVELDSVSGFQGAEAVHLDRAEVDPCVESLWQVGRGDRSPTFLEFVELDGAVRHVGSMAGTCWRGNRVRVCGGLGVARCLVCGVWLVECLRDVGDACGNEPFGVLLLRPQGGQSLAKSLDFAQPGALLGLGDAFGEVVLEFVQQGQSAGFGAQHGAADCLTCPDFLSDGQFLDQHRDQLARTRTLIAAGESSGNTRLVEMNRQVETNLTRMIATIEQLHASLNNSLNNGEGDPRGQR